MACNYTFRGVTYESYAALAEALGSDRSLYEGMIDIIFSKADKGKIANLAIGEMKGEFHPAKSGRADDVTADMVSRDGYINVQRIPEQDWFLINGENPELALDKEGKVDEMVKWMTVAGMRPEEARARAEGYVNDKWERVAADAYKFHEMFAHVSDNEPSTWKAAAAGSSFDNARLIPILAGDKGVGAQIYARVCAGSPSRRNESVEKGGVTRHKNVIVTGELHNVPNGAPDKLIAHADYISVGDDGRVDVYNVKVSCDPFDSRRNGKKLEHYRYEAALMRRALEQRGVDMSNSSFNIIPVQLEYDADWESVVGVNVQNTIPLDMWNGRIIDESFDSACAPYVDVNVSPVKFDFPSLNEATDMLSKIFPGRNFRAEGIALDAERWVNMSWERCNPVPRKGGGWTLTIPQTHEKVEVEDHATKSRNREFVKWVADHLSGSSESLTGSRGAAELARNIKKAFTSVGRYDTSGDSANKLYMKELMAPYLFGTEWSEDGKMLRTRWNVVESAALDAANIVGLVEKESKQLDLFVMTPNDPGSLIKLDGNNENILSAVGLADMNDVEFVMKSTWGNIEALRVCAVLDSLAAAGELNEGLKLGKLHVICINESDANIQNGDVYDIANLAKEWSKIVRVVNRNASGGPVLRDRLNNSGVKFMTTDEVLIRMWNGICNYGGWTYDTTKIKDFKDIFNDHYELDGTLVQGLVNAQTGSKKVELLLQLQSRLTDLLNGKTPGSGEVSSVRNWDEMIRLAGQENTYGGALARLYMATADMLRVYDGSYVPYVEELTELDAKASRAAVVREASYRKVVAMVTESTQLINGRVCDQYLGDVKPLFDRYYISCGYSKLRNKVLGDTTKIYERLLEKDEDGHKTFRFKNPYVESNDLRPYEREFLKGLLYQFYRVRCDVMGKRLDISGPNDPNLKDGMPANYLDIPLQRASKVSQWSDVKGMLKRVGNKVVGTVTHPIESIREYLMSLKDTSAVDYANREFARMQFTNRYAEYEDNPTRRAEYIAQKGEGWFETDIENVFIDYLYTQRRVEEMKNLMLKVDAVEMHLALTGKQYGDRTNIERILDSIDKYVKTVVYKGSIMEKQSLWLENAMKGLRKVTSEILFGLAGANAVRDVLLGLAGNFAAAVTKYNTEASVKDLTKAYMFVMTDCFKNMRDMGLLNLFNLKYGFSSFDYGDVSRKLHRQVGALVDWSSFLFCTMKGPDFLNRLTLFVARLMHDGSFKAYSCDKNGKLVYNWRFDERFSELAKGDAADKKSQKYLLQKGRYADLIEAFNKENPDLHLKATDDLPDGYTMKEINSIKRLGEQLYGAYDYASRSLIEKTAIGRNFLFFFTFYNGINEIWFKKTGIDERTVKDSRIYNEEGKPMSWQFNDDGTQTLTTVDTGVPAHEKVSAFDQGIFATLKTMWGAFTKEKLSVKEYYDKYVRDNERVKSNYKWMMFSLGMTAVFTALLAGVVRPAYKRRKEEMDPQALAENIIVEMLYRGWSRSADYFSGPLMILKYFGDSTNPVTYDMGTKMLTDAYKVLAGKQMFGETALSYSAFYRNMSDSLSAFYKDMARQDGTAMEEEARKREKEQRKGKASTVR